MSGDVATSGRTMITQIFVRGPTGHLAFDVNLRMTGLDMKERFSERTGIPVECVWFMCGTRILEDGLSLEEAGVRAGDTLRPHFRSLKKKDETGGLCASGL